ncbi:MAG: radical SAM family heme chaperone HemW [Rhodospirillales bacterium]
MADRAAGPGFGVYVHWPYCESKCPYCDFNSHVADRIDHARWRRAYAAELDDAAAEWPVDGRPLVTSIFFGGGTPSLAEPETIGAVIADVCRRFPVADGLEITLEANPSSAEAARFAAFAQAGVNRLSLGVQSLDDEALRFLGRRHGRAEALRAIELAQRTFGRSSFDLIAARPGQAPADWDRELQEAVSLAADHLSVYQLTIESGTPFARDGVPEADEDTGAAIFEATRSRLSAAGLGAYEISNHARDGFACRHNLTYWRGGEYLGIGPGAHGRIRPAGSWQAEHRIHGPTRWLEAVERQGHGRAKRRVLAAAERAQEVVLTGMRLTGGLLDADLQASVGAGISGAVDAAGLDRLVAGGLVERTPAGLRATSEGQLRLNGVVAMLLGG